MVRVKHCLQPITADCPAEFKGYLILIFFNRAIDGSTPDVAGDGVPNAIYGDDWDEHQPIDSGLTPPADRYEPQRGFGKVWRENPWVRDLLGWAIAPEQPGTANLQAFNNGLMLSLSYLDPPMLYAYGPEGRLQIVDPRPLR
jgi:hypothetical protein